MGGEKREEARRLVEEVAARLSTAGNVEAGAPGSKGAGKKSDVEELREVLKAISDFLKDLKEPLEKLFNTMLSAMDGSRLGEEVAAFYRKLRESGMPEDMAAEMTREFFRARIESFNIMSLLTKSVKKEVIEEGGRGE